MDLTVQVPMQYCSLQHCFYHQSHPQLGVDFALGPSLHSFSALFSLSRVISLLIFSIILVTYQPWEFIFQCSIFLPFHTVHEVLKAGILNWFAIPFSSGPHFFRTLHHDQSVLGGCGLRQGCGLCD